MSGVNNEDTERRYLSIPPESIKKPLIPPESIKKPLIFLGGVERQVLSVSLLVRKMHGYD